MNRHTEALKTLGSDMSLIEIVATLSNAVREAEIEGVDPCSDSAVMLLGSQVAFMTHADITTKTMFDRVVASCVDNQNEFVINTEKH